MAPTGPRSFRGDFYDITPAGDRLLVTVGDVFGSGLPAAQTMVRDALGLRAGARSTQRTLRLRPGDLLVCFTDGVLQQWDLERLVHECERAQHEGGLAALVERLLPPVEDEACLVALRV